MRSSLVFLFIHIVLCSCQNESTKIKNGFTLISSEDSGIEFSNDLSYDEKFNIYTYRNFYNGGGVAIGNFVGDSLPDIYLTANMGANKLFENLGSLKFKDVTLKSGVGGIRSWSTGVSSVDLNADGLLDIYVCNSGKNAGAERSNELFLNQGEGRFIECADSFNIADQGLSTHAAFFDYDKDGDLDMYLLNNSFEAIGSFNLRKKLRPIRDSLGGDKLLKNMLHETGALWFEDVSVEAGIYGSVIGFGLGVTVSDFDLDGWPDIYVSNDFFERDYLYLNNQKGGFEESLETSISSTSAASMGADAADINGDEYPEIFVTDMLPIDEKRLKVNTTFDDWNNYRNKVDNGYFHQFTRNTLQLNQGNRSFSEVGRAYGVEASDWSWGALLLDLDTDGDRDLFIANGIFQDLTNQDYIAYLASEQAISRVTASGSVDFKLLVDLIPSAPVKNEVFLYNDESEFFDRADSSFGLSTSGFSNGSAYGDLDGDGDLDLVVNNVNTETWLYRNESPRDDLHNSLSIFLKGLGLNTHSIGTRVTAYSRGKKYSAEQIPTRGFQSSSEPFVFLGLGDIQKVDSIKIYWSSGGCSTLYDVIPGRIVVDENVLDKEFELKRNTGSRPKYVELDPAEVGIDFTHIESIYSDFDRERLLSNMLSTQGPALCAADVNNDGLDDLFFGGAANQESQLYIQKRNGKFVKSKNSCFVEDRKFEDVDAIFLDFDQDGDEDLVVASGSSEFSPDQLRLRDRLYINNGSGLFHPAPRSVWPSINEVTSCVVKGDFDGDNDLDLFIGSRMRPKIYGVASTSYILINQNGTYSNESKIALDLGMVTDACVGDFDDDDVNEVFLTQDWGYPLKVSLTDSIVIVDTLLHKSGWWSTISISEAEKPSDNLILLGNHGLNSRLKASVEKPMEMLVNDFDGNGSPEQIISVYNGDKPTPIILRHDLVMQIPSLKKKYLKYDSYHGQSVRDIFGERAVMSSIKYSTDELKSGLLTFPLDSDPVFFPFSNEGQLAPIFTFSELEKNEFIAGGNLYAVKPELGRYDASDGFWFNNKGESDYSRNLGLPFSGEIRTILKVGTIDGFYIVCARNNDVPQIFKRVKSINEN